MTIGFDSVLFRRVAGVLLASGAACLAACSHSGSGGSQVVASVGGDEITETQVNHALERQANLRPDQVDAASRKAVSNLVEQTVVLQKARDLKLDRDERVMQNIETMKREAMVSAYLNRIADGASKPSDKDIQAYFDANPQLFSQRRIYTFQELAVDVPADKVKETEAALAQLKSGPEIGEFLRGKQIPTHATQNVMAAESVPQALLARVAQLKPGQGVIVSNENGLHILLLAATQDQPVDLEKSRPAIAAYLTNQNKRQAVQKELASLQAVAKVSYFGKYADMAASAPSAAGSAVAMAAPSASATLK